LLRSFFNIWRFFLNIETLYSWLFVHWALYLVSDFVTFVKWYKIWLKERTLISIMNFIDNGTHVWCFLHLIILIYVGFMDSLALWRNIVCLQGLPFLFLMNTQCRTIFLRCIIWFIVRCNIYILDFRDVVHAYLIYCRKFIFFVFSSSW